MNKDSKTIFEKQNKCGLVAVQKTASCCYSRGKYWSVVLVVFSVFVPVLINVVLAFYNSVVLNGILIVFTLICFIISELIRLIIKKWKRYGAGMQQYFDEMVFSLKNTCKKYICPKKLNQHDRIKLIQKFEKKENAPFYDWYSYFSNLPYEEAVYQCQKQNIRWDISVRKKYLVSLIIVTSLIIVGVIIHAILRTMDILLMITILATLVPLGTFLYNGIKKLYKDIKSQMDLYKHIENIEGKQKKNKLWDEIEELQLEIFYYRQKAYLIPDWFYKLSRKEKQKEEDNFAKKIQKQ